MGEGGTKVVNRSKVTAAVQVAHAKERRMFGSSFTLMLFDKMESKLLPQLSGNVPHSSDLT